MLSWPNAPVDKDWTAAVVANIYSRGESYVKNCLADAFNTSVY